MIVRIVRMQFKPEAVQEFLDLFEERKKLIRASAGCQHLELWQDAHDSSIFYTYSLWETEDSLNHYRFSELFKDTWSKTKPHFAVKAQAWSALPFTTANPY